MKVFLDTNVLASGFGTRGLCADVIREVLTSHELIVSAELLAELEGTLKAKFKVPVDLIEDVLAMLREDAHLALSKPRADLPIRDAGDIAILSAAINANADVFVTGDKEILDLQTVGNLKILSPRGLWEAVTGD